MTSRFSTLGRFDITRVQQATVLIERGAGLFSVRPYRRRRVYTLPLSTVAEMVTARVIKAEIQQRRAEKKARRRP